MKPIGTIFTMKNEPTMYMIVSYYVKEETTDEVHDYLACLYPIGFDGNLPYTFVNDNEIDYIIHEGLETNNFSKYIELLGDELAKESEVKTNKKIELAEFTEL